MGGIWSDKEIETMCIVSHNQWDGTVFLATSNKGTRQRQTFPETVASASEGDMSYVFESSIIRSGFVAMRHPNWGCCCACYLTQNGRPLWIRLRFSGKQREINHCQMRGSSKAGTREVLRIDHRDKKAVKGGVKYLNG